MALYALKSARLKGFPLCFGLHFGYPHEREYLCCRRLTYIRAAWETSLLYQKFDVGFVLEDSPLVSVVLGVYGIEILNSPTYTAY